MTSVIRFFSIVFVFVAGTAGFGAAVAGSNAIPEDPIAFIGHGALFDREGNEITPDIEFLQATQEFYLRVLSERLTPADRDTFLGNSSKLLTDDSIDSRSRLLVNTRMLNWILQRTGDEADGSISGKISLISDLLRYADPVKRGERVEPPSDILDKLDQAGFGAISTFSTVSTGEAYIAECLANGVPTPPDIGSAAWQKSVPGGSSVLTPTQLFIVTEISAEVNVYKSTAPEGMCIALPRSANPGTAGNEIYLDGVICLGKTTGKACFWDNQVPDGEGGPGPAATFIEGTVIPINQFAGGADLFGGSGGVCTSCHAGENPYNIHPKTPLGRPALSGFPLVADVWYTPIVHGNWPQNAGQIDQTLVPDACAMCHDEGGPGGRFPMFTSQLAGQFAYCNKILKAATKKTMPPGAPGSLENDAAIQTLVNMCLTATASPP